MKKGLIRKDKTERCLNGRDPPDLAFEMDRIFRQYGDRVYGWSLFFAAGQLAWAEDRCQEILIKLLRPDLLPKVIEVESHGNLPGWLKVVTFHHCINVRKRERRWYMCVLPQLRSMNCEPELPFFERHDLNLVQSMLSTLPTTQARALRLVFLEGETQQEAAAKLGFSKGYVSKIIKKGLRRLESLFADTERMPTHEEQR